MFNKNTDYYSDFRSGATDRTKALIRRRNDLTQTIEQAQRNLGKEQENVVNLKSRIAQLKGLNNISLTDDDLTFQKFKTSLKKLNVELETSEEICEALAAEVIPQKTNELKVIETKIKNVLRAYVLECKLVADKRIQRLLDDCATERESFLAAFRRIYQDAGETFIVNAEELLPGPWRAREILTPGPILDETPPDKPGSIPEVAQDEQAPPEDTP